MQARARASRRAALSRLASLPLPRPRLLALVLIAALPLALAAITPVFVTLAALVLVAAVVLAIVDFRATPSPSSVPIERVAQPQLSIGVGNKVVVRLPRVARPQ